LYQKTFLYVTPKFDIVSGDKEMAETQTQKKKRKKQQLAALEQVQEETAIQNAIEVAQALEELEKQGILLDVQVAPGARVQRFAGLTL
jgi:hypothetical protein